MAKASSADLKKLFDTQQGYARAPSRDTSETPLASFPPSKLRSHVHV